VPPFARSEAHGLLAHSWRSLPSRRSQTIGKGFHVRFAGPVVVMQARSAGVLFPPSWIVEIHTFPDATIESAKIATSAVLSAADDNLRITLPDLHRPIQFIHHFQHLQPQIGIDVARLEPIVHFGVSFC
jgi:hypothetical protein